MTTPALFPLALRMGDLPVRATFTYDGWAHGTITENTDGWVRATITAGGSTATTHQQHPGEEVEA